MYQRRSIGREIGTAFAVLAIYLLTVLAPLHHARASQLDFAALGYETIAGSWVLCAPLDAQGPDSDASLIAKCPAAGIGKDDLVEPAIAVIELGVLVATEVLAPASVAAVHHRERPELTAAPRGPPALA